MQANANLSPDSTASEKLPAPFDGGNFDDEVWSVSIPAKGGNYNLSWSSVIFADGTALTAPQHRKLLDGAKLFLLLASEGKCNNRPNRGGTLVGKFVVVIALIRWMWDRGLRSFKELTLPQVIGYRNAVERQVRKQGCGKPRSQRLGISTRSQAAYLAVIARLAALQPEMHDLGTAFSDREIHDLASHLRISVSTENATKIIPDAIFRSLLDGAMHWVKVEATKVLQVQTAFEEWRQRRPHIQFEHKKTQHEILNSDMLPLGVTVPFNGALRDLRSLTYRDLVRLVTITRGACLVVIAGVVGMRESEIGSLEAGCLRSVPIKEGLSVLELAGTLYKTSRADKGVPAEWCAGYEEAENPILLAVRVLEQLPHDSKTNALFSPMFQQSKSKRNRVCTSTMRKCLKAFAISVGVTEWKLTLHQFRKTFARFVALSSVSGVFALMRHFKHMSVLMTERYLSWDPEQINDIFEATQSVVAEQLNSIFGAERLGGIAGRRIVENNAPYRGAANAEARSRLVAMTARDPSAYFRPMPLGMCLYDELRANCRGKVADVGIDSCIGCYNFAVDVVNLPSWLEAREVLEATIGEQASFGFVSIDLHKQLGEVNRIIAEIEEKADGRTA